MDSNLWPHEEINIGSEAYQNDHMLHLEQDLTSFAADLQYTDSSLSSRFSFQLPFMDQNLLGTNGSHLLDAPIPSDPHLAAMDDTPTYYSHNLGFSSHQYSSQLPFHFGGQSYQNDHMPHFDQDVTSLVGNLGYTDSSLPSRFMDQNLLGTNGSYLVDAPIPSDPHRAAVDDTTYYSHNLGFLSHQYSSLDHPLSSVIPTSNNPLMEIVQGATSPSLGQTRHGTGNSSRRHYKKYNSEDVRQLILAVSQHGTRWKLIAQLPYFKDSGRTSEQLMDKYFRLMNRR